MEIKKIWEKVSAEQANFLLSLFERWLFEPGTEVPDRYLAAIQARVPEAVSIDKPFNVLCKGNDGHVVIDVVIRNGNIELRGILTSSDSANQNEVCRVIGSLGLPDV